MADYSILIGGKAGDGVNRAGQVIAKIFTRLGFFSYMYYDYPSLIRGGHNYAVVRVADHPVGGCREGIDVLLALDSTTLRRHKTFVRNDAVILYNSDLVHDAEGTAIPLLSIITEEEGSPVMANTCLIGAFCKSIGLEWNFVEEVLRLELPHEVEKNLRIARRGYGAVPVEMRPEFLHLAQKGGDKILLTGNEAIALGMVAAGLDGYVAYPMSPATGILHYMAEIAEEAGVTVIHPESEIAAMNMVAGMVYGGFRAATGTAGGGFNLMVEGLSMAAMAELPVTVVLAQRIGPSTGTPTYTAQEDLNYAIYAGNGEFPRFIFAPGDAGQAYECAGHALRLSWKYQVPSLILTDKTLAEGTYTVEPSTLPELIPAQAITRIGPVEEYRRYSDSEDGISPYAIPGDGSVTIKVNSKTHRPDGISTDTPEGIAGCIDKQMRKLPAMRQEVSDLRPVIIYGNPDAEICLLCWGSNAPLCREVAGRLGIKAVQPLVMWPFPAGEVSDAVGDSWMVISVEDNYAGQLADLARHHGIRVDLHIPKYDGRPHSIDGLVELLWGVVA
ncbi:hypothetical protein AZH53_01865 [Methanomicrobiaceae archaeon CYW5]|uniref:2-oxoacid:acceptor oxidoreductase subunit alpha n=1 Tax=Methanovulcanius yangii TaxID=1789227 RepID=UPI0029CA00BD|nr:2-oxoacid:acceptor oxidoreductase subunit alpha [Methanovulcanius yangii]MBT8507176.1 hypothetical protein [Methanovulcanius yangii]